MVNPYIKNFLITLQDSFNYRGNFIINFFTGFLYNYATVAVWYAIVMSNKSTLDQSMITNTIKYMILASTTSAVLLSISPFDITTKVTKGEIARDLLYPISLPVNLFFKNLGAAVTTLMTNVIPAIIILTILFRPVWDFKLINMAGFFIGGLMGYYLYYLFNLQVDMISFWWLETFYFHYIKDAVFKFLSGSLVPLWFYPEWILKILDWLPFKNVVFAPIAFFLGKIPLNEFIFQMKIFSIWLILMTLLTYIIWRNGIKKVVIQGG